MGAWQPQLRLHVSSCSAHGTMLAASSGHLARFWDVWAPFYDCPFVRERIGKIGDGGKYLCGVSSLLQRPGCLVFSIGSNGETSFEEAILDSTPCEVHTWDHTLDEAKKQVVLSVTGIKLHQIGLAGESSAVRADMMTLTAMLTELQRHWIDVLKMDIEADMVDMDLQ
ncbi:hypothetical protein WJX81_005767 [Elliptochloris bilobata]|uniref:Methyltransferase domain-containing protein n=1 Tax=Elliptochloris bilobata TaxID=381761 RepID=A0AAW1S4S0_9CHLO